MASTAHRLGRLDALKAALASGDVRTAADLAAELEVSERTIRRDLATLRESGVPIEGDRGRGGGTRLEPGWSLGRVHLNEAEALGLLLGLTIAEKVGSPLLLDDLASVRRKMVRAFAPSQARRITRLRHRVLTGGAASARVLDAYVPPPPAVASNIGRCFLLQQLAEITYTTESGDTTIREIEAQYLYYNVPVWYVLAWDRLRDDVRFFRLDRISAITVRPDPFRLRPQQPFLDAGEPTASPL